MIKINKITPQVVAIYKSGELLGFVNEYEFNDLRIQIMSEGAEDFSVRFEDKEEFIDKDGRLSFWPIGMFDLLQEQWEVLLRWDKNDQN